MWNRRPFIERDSRGRERLVLGRSSSHSHRRASFYGDKISQEVGDDTGFLESSLIAQVSSLQTQLSMAQRDQWHLQNLRNEHQRVVNEHYHCRNMRAQLEAQVREVRRIEDLLIDEEERNAKLEHKNEKLEEKVGFLKRGSGEGYQRRYEEKLVEVEMLRARMVDKDNAVRLAETRIADKNSTIVYLKNYLRAHGFRIED